VTHDAIEVRDLCYAYPGHGEALRGVSFGVAPGEAVGIIGCNGAGKSTLLLHLNGCLAPARGEVRIGGVLLTRQTLGQARRAVGLVFQDPDDQLFMPTVFEDVAFGPLNQGLADGEAEARSLAALQRVGMAHLRDRPPHRLSAGEKRAVAIATVLAMEPDILVMDEPTAHLDPRGRRRLIDLLRTFAHTKIIATHDLELVVDLCSRVFVMDAGRIVAAGSTAELLGDEALMLAHGLECPHSLRNR
jgi:cobalt/nickel transport system ATP-binding protein